MKKIILHLVSVFISMIWLIEHHQTYNPITLKGPAFLKFYLLLLLAFYLSVIYIFLRKAISKTTVYFSAFILALGIVKLFKGLMLGKPVGYLVMILFMEVIMFLFIILNSKK